MKETGLKYRMQSILMIRLPTSEVEIIIDRFKNIKYYW